MDKNIAAILRENTKTVHVMLHVGKGDDPVIKTYTYVTTLDLEPSDLVVIDANGICRVAEVMRVDNDLEIEPNSSIKYKWVIAKVDTKAYNADMVRNTEIERRLAGVYRKNARAAYAQQFLEGVDAETVALVKG